MCATLDLRDVSPNAVIEHPEKSLPIDALPETVSCMQIDSAITRLQQVGQGLGVGVPVLAGRVV